MSDTLNWQIITRSNSPKFMMKGSILARVICGQWSRFSVEEVRWRDAGDNAIRLYRVRDADTVSDAQVAKGIKPKIVGTFQTLHEAMAMVDAARVVYE